MHMFSTLVLAAACASAPVAVHAADGVERDAIRFAQIAPLTGPAAATGLGLRAGLLAAFDEANRAGGIHGRTVALETLCDGGNPAGAVARMRTVLASHAHVAVIATSGAAQARAIQPMANAETLPLIGAATGDEALRAPWATNAFNIRPTKAAEMRALAAHLVEAHGVKRIGVLYEGDEAGRTLLKTVETALSWHDIVPVAHGRFERGTTAVKVALLTIRRSGPDAVLLLGGHDAAAEPGFASLEGYLAGRLALSAVEDAGPWLDRNRLRAALGRMGEIDLGGLMLHFGPGDNQGLDDAFLFQIAPEGRLEPVQAPPPEGAS